MSKLYRSANGKVVDLDQLMLKSEDAIAVGNMKVNARGDELGPGGKVIKTRNQRVTETYKLHSMVPTDDVVHADAVSATSRNGLTPEPKYDAPTEVTTEPTPKAEKRETAGANTSKRQRGGLAASIAKTRVVGAEPTEITKTVKRIQNGGE